MLGVSDQALVDPQSFETLTEALHKDVAGVIEPRVNRLVPGVDDGGEVPSAVFLEPSGDRERLVEVAVEVGLIARFPAGFPIEV
jgi:hypothetical protein